MMSSPYEVLPPLQDEQGEVTLVASFTANNGIRIALLDTESIDQDWREFDFDREQALLIGETLVRWSKCAS